VNCFERALLVRGMFLNIIVNFKYAKSANSSSVTFDTFPISIGRSSLCDLTLDDETRYVSSQHAELSCKDSAIILTDTSLNGTFLNQSPSSIGKGNTTVLSDGDVLYIGDYELQLRVSPRSTDTSSAIVSTPDFDNPFSDDPFSDDDRSTPDMQNHSDLILGDTNDQSQAASTLDSEAGYVIGRVNDASHIQPTLKDDHLLDLNEEDTEPADWTDEPNSMTDGSIDLLVPDTNKANADTDESNGTTNDGSWDEWINSINSSTPDTPSHPPKAPEKPQMSTKRNSDDVLGALLTGAGLNPSDFASLDSTELANHIGSILNRSTQSMMLLLRSRDEIKSAMRADVTLLGSVNNSPLRFSVSVEDALKKLLTPSTDSGFTESNQAIEKCLHDIKVHQLAMLEAMRSALHIALSHFEPEKLEQKTRETSPVASTLPLAREAKLWEQFQLHYHELKQDTVDDFSNQFGKELKKAYEKSVSELKPSDQ